MRLTASVLLAVALVALVAMAGREESEWHRPSAQTMQSTTNVLLPAGTVPMTASDSAVRRAGADAAAAMTER